MFDITTELPTGPLLLEASAGTGKTWTIAALTARFIAESGTSIEEFLLITFSNKAATELRSRVFERLQDTERALVEFLDTGRIPDDAVAALLCRWNAELSRTRLRAALDAQIRAILAKEGIAAVGGIFALVIVFGYLATVAARHVGDTALLIALAATLPRQIELSMDVHALAAGGNDLLALWTRLGGVRDAMRPAADPRFEQRIEFPRLVLIDGGLPLDVPDGLTADQIVSHILGPTAERLNMRFDETADYLGFWRDHPAFREAWTPELEDYLAYDLVPDGDRLRPATSYATTADDTVDLNTGTAIREAIDALRHDTLFVTVPRGLRDETPGLFAADRIDALIAPHPTVRHVRLPDLNHYTVVMSPQGAAALGPLLRAELAR